MPMPTSTVTSSEPRIWPDCSRCARLPAGASNQASPAIEPSTKPAAMPDPTSSTDGSGRGQPVSPADGKTWVPKSIQAHVQTPMATE
jgi:hypothetical protein